MLSPVKGGYPERAWMTPVGTSGIQRCHRPSSCPQDPLGHSSGPSLGSTAYPGLGVGAGNVGCPCLECSSENGRGTATPGNWAGLLGPCHRRETEAQGSTWSPSAELRAFRPCCASSSISGLEVGGSGVQLSRCQTHL